MNTGPSGSSSALLPLALPSSLRVAVLLLGGDGGFRVSAHSWLFLLPLCVTEFNKCRLRRTLTWSRVLKRDRKARLQQCLPFRLSALFLPSLGGDQSLIFPGFSFFCCFIKINRNVCAFVLCSQTTGSTTCTVWRLCFFHLTSLENLCAISFCRYFSLCWDLQVVSAILVTNTAAVRT